MTRKMLLLLLVFTWANAGLAQEVQNVYSPPTIVEPEWLEGRRAAQLEAAAKWRLLDDFSFVDQLDQSGIGFRNYCTDESGKHWQPIHYDHGNGLAAADVNLDGHVDLYFTTQAGGNELWINQGDGTFADSTEAAGVAVAEPVSVGASFADIDNDGDADLYVTVIRAGNALFANDGEGRFADISAGSGLDYRGHSSGALFFDYDRDGLVDLFLANVGSYTTDVAVPAQAYRGAGQAPIDYEYYIGLEDAFSGHLKPERFEASLLFRNLGQQRFADVSTAMRLQDTSWAGDAAVLDANRDGWPDLYVLNMQGHDHYYENVGGEYFVDKSRALFPKTPWGAMGIEVFDFDNDGLMDIFITDMHSDMSQKIGPEKEKLKADMQYPEDFLQSGGQSLYGNAFFRAQAEGDFAEISDQVGAENYWPWGLSSGDLNADGYEDVFIASSMNYPFRYAVNSVLLNDGGQGFLDSEFVLGVEPRRDGRTAQPWFALDCSGADQAHEACEGRRGPVVVWGALGSRASVIVDLDGDGDLDIATNEFNDVPMVLISDLAQRHPISYLKVELRGAGGSPLGARVTVFAGERAYSKVYDGKSGYLSQSLYPLYFGLDGLSIVDRIEVVWPAGQVQIFPGPLSVNRLVVLQQE